MTGLLLVDKPSGMTSHDVVDRIRRAAGIRRIGHTGTLDPAATGLLILCLDKATRLSEHLTGLDKVYEGVMRLGVETDSYDLDGAVVAERAVPETTIEALQALSDRFVGEIEQVPPMVSAVKVGGERLYEKARKGEVVERVARKVTVREFSVLSYTPPDAMVRVACTRGTYVRSLCHDVGQLLGCGAVLAALRRTMVGRFSVQEALPVDAFTGPDVVKARLLPIDNALDLPSVVIRDSCRPQIEAGGSIGLAEMRGPCPVRSGWVQIKTESGRLIALGQVEPNAMGGRVHPKRVFNR
jgi:tRNA pseudouridine55 synthase